MNLDEFGGISRSLLTKTAIIPKIKKRYPQTSITCLWNNFDSRRRGRVHTAILDFDQVLYLLGIFSFLFFFNNDSMKLKPMKPQQPVTKIFFCFIARLYYLNILSTLLPVFL